MRDHRPQLTQQLFNDAKLSQFQQHVNDILELNKVLQSILNPQLTDYCRAANIRDNQLLIEVANASLLTKLNFERIQILSEFRRSGYARLASIEFKVNPELYQQPKMASSKKSEKKMNHLSQDAAQSILMAAEMAPPKLKQRLEKIAKLAQDK